MEIYADAEKASEYLPPLHELLIDSSSKMRFPKHVYVRSGKGVEETLLFFSSCRD